MGHFDISGHEDFNAIIDALTGPGWVELPQYFSEDFCLELVKDFDQILQNDKFRAARIGPQSNSHLKKEVRSDQIHWWIPGQETETQRTYLAWVEQLKKSLNQSLYLGLKDEEFHYTYYTDKAYYDRHVDNFLGQSPRKISLLVYLNQNWKESDGGRLELYADEKSQTPLARVCPEMGSLVCFLSEKMPHAVEPSMRPRKSLTGWLRN